MNKNKLLLASAVLGLFTGAVHAQTNVTVYGMIDVGISRADSGAAANASTLSMDSGIQAGSRIGFKGSEDLGGGMSVSFQLENGFDSSTGQLQQGGRIFGRQSWVGLNGGYGSVKFGRMWAPVYVAVIELDPFGAGLAGDASRILGSGAYPLRTQNTINYFLPEQGGFSGVIGYSLGETAGSFSDNRQIGAGFGYVNGPLNVQFGYNKANTTAAPVVADTTQSLLGGIYDLGAVKVHLAYGQSHVDSNVAGTSYKDRNWMLGASVPVGAGTIMASYIRNDVRNVANADSTQLAIGYSHQLSKRTNVYTSYARVSNDAGAALGGAAVAGNDPSLFNVGIRHVF